MTTMQQLANDARRAEAFKQILSAEKARGLVDTFLVLNDWSGAATKLDQVCEAYGKAAATLREIQTLERAL